jgi:hypothetical protein
MHARLATALAALLLAATAGAQDWTVTGRFLYEDKAWGWEGWTGEWSEKPVRHADVLVLDAQHGQVLGRGLTDAEGEFAVSCHHAGSGDVLVRVEASDRFRRGADWTAPTLAVLDPQGRRWSASTPVVQGVGGLDLDTGTTTALAVTADGNDGNPFNLYDMLVAAWERVASESGAKPRGRMRLSWPCWSGSWAWKRTAHIAVDDGYDDAVVLHEIGHLVHNAWSESDSPGGMHWFGDSDQDPRLSFAEGWATCFAGDVLSSLGAPAVYMDCEGGAQLGGVQLRLDLESVAPYAATALGSTDEIAVACSIFDLLDDPAGGDDEGFSGGLSVAGLTPHRAWWQVFTGPARHAARLSLDTVWDGWSRLFGEDGDFEQLRPIFDLRGLRFWNDAFEPDNTPEQATTLLAGGGWSAEHTLYWAPTQPAPRGSGDADWFAVQLQKGQVVRIETRYPAGAPDACTQADTHLVLFDPQGQAVAASEDGGVGRNARVDLQVQASGTWRFRVDTRNPIGRYGRYEARVQLLSP